MKYTAQSLKYICKNFLHLLPFAIIPAFFLAVSTDGESINCIIEQLMTGSLTEMHFDHIFYAISVLNFNFQRWWAVLGGFLALITLIGSTAMLTAMIEKHLRIGKRTYNGLLSKMNDNFVSTLGYGLLLFFLYEIWALITATILWGVVHIPVTWLAYVLVILLFLVMQILLIALIGVIYLWLPCMQITGFRALEAFQYSYQLTAPFKFKLLLVQLFFLLGVEALTCVLALFVPDTVVFLALTTVMYALLFMLYCVRMEIAYFDSDNIERADITKNYR